MDKKTAAIIFTVVATVSAATWVIRSEIATNAVSIAELRGLILAHIYPTFSPTAAK